jgi:hypothetical protein
MFTLGRQGGVPGVATVAGIVIALAGPAAPIVVPILAGIVFATWVYVVYQKRYRHENFITRITK